MKKMDYIFAGIVIILSGICFLLAFGRADSGMSVEIMCNNELYGVYDLYLDQNFKVYDEQGHFNDVLISNGAVSVIDADCKDKLCVSQHAISRPGETIICLPHMICIRIIGNSDADLDSVAN